MPSIFHGRLCDVGDQTNNVLSSSVPPKGKEIKTACVELLYVDFETPALASADPRPYHASLSRRLLGNANGGNNSRNFRIAQHHGDFELAFHQCWVSLRVETQV
jgi:hypothetical protein